MGVLRYWDAECRRFLDSRDHVEVNGGFRMAARELE